MPPEVFIPAVALQMEKLDEFSRFWVDTGEVWTFVEVAAGAGADAFPRRFIHDRRLQERGVAELGV